MFKGKKNVEKIENEKVFKKEIREELKTMQLYMVTNEKEIRKTLNIQGLARGSQSKSGVN